MSDLQPPYLTIRTRSTGTGNGSRMNPGSGTSMASASTADYSVPSMTHDISRVNYHVKHLDSFAKSLEDSASRAFPNRGRSQQRYTRVKALLMHWKSDDLFVLPELEDLEKCMSEDYGFETDTFSIPSENSHLELMLRLGAMIKDFESPDTLFIVYYGGHARIDESRQSTWCATRNPNSPWLQWSAIQTLLERSVSDTLILLDCCAGAASATFPTGKSITETISASSWDAIAPDPGRYSFTNALIEVLQEWQHRIFSAAMLHAEVLARLKHPRPITINGKYFEARSTPVHFMMTSNHRAPSIEIGRTLPRRPQLPSPPVDDHYAYGPSGGRGPVGGPVKDPNEDEPHVMISLALEDDQNLDLNAWETWLASFPALAKHVKVQGVFKSHSTLLLLSVPVMVWDLLPENRACSFVAFIRSNNYLAQPKTAVPVPVAESQKMDVGTAADVGNDVAGEDVLISEYDADENNGDGNEDTVSVISGTTFSPTEGKVPSIRMSIASTAVASTEDARSPRRLRMPRSELVTSPRGSFRFSTASEFPSASASAVSRSGLASTSHYYSQSQNTGQSLAIQQKSVYTQDSSASSSKALVHQQREQHRETFDIANDSLDEPAFAPHITGRLEEYFQSEPNPSVGISEFFASNLGVDANDIHLWFHRRRQQESTRLNLQNLRMDEHSAPESFLTSGPKTILPGHLNMLLDIFPPNMLLFIDLRSPTDFEKSHIYGAVNLRAPATFIEQSYDLLSLAFTDEQSRRSFARGPSSRCVIFYDRVVEFGWECPVADVLIRQMRERSDWHGDCYVLKGHYREFSSSFDKYITGDKMTQTAKDYVDGLRQREPLTHQETVEMEEKYTEWMSLVENESRAHLVETPADLDERMQMVEMHQAQLEDELQRRNPVLYHKAMGLRPPPRKRLPGIGAITCPSREKDLKDSKEGRVEFVLPLARGLKKMQGQSSYKATAPGYDKLDEGNDASGAMGLDDFDEIDPRDEQLQDDPAFIKAGSYDEASRGSDSPTDPRRSRERSFWKRLRTNK